ncbi:hypothetical protein GEMRC1_009388 [Eukaryota sp. GEM-RC1]
MLHLECTICNNTFKDAATLHCGHSFCLLCVTQWLEHNKQCPICRNTAVMNDVVPSYALRDAADTLSKNPAVLPEITREEITFDIASELGSGLSGSVYRSEWADTSVALKLVRRAAFKEDKLLQEVSHMASLSHPFVLRVFGITRLEKHIGIVMELGSGHLEVPSSLSTTTLSQAIDICTAVKFLHSKGIVHHDIKPQNIIIVDSKVKLADFGSAHTMHHYTSTLEMTPKYTPPEAFDKKYGPAYDVYSLGVLLYEMFVNQLAFQDMSYAEMVQSKMNGDLLDFPDSFPQSISALINKCLSVDPNQRPSVTELLNELKNVLITEELIPIYKYSELDDEVLCECESDESAPNPVLDVNQMINAGHFFHDGNVVGKDVKKAVYWFLEAYSLGSSQARTFLELTISWCEERAPLGEVLAMTALGICFEHGQGVEFDILKAFSWYKKAAQLGNSMAINNLGRCFELGRGVKQDLVKAVSLYKKAAEMGNSVAMNNLGRCFELGRGVKQVLVEAFSWYKKAAELRNSMAMNNLGRCFELDRGVKQDLVKAFSWYKKAAEYENPSAICNLGRCHEYGIGTPTNYVQAVQCFKEAAALGNILALSLLGVCFEAGRGVPQSYLEAFQSYQKAAELGSALGMSQLGQCYESGKGVSTNIEEAFQCYQKAAGLNDCFAMNQLGVCYKHGKE